jgi:F0F1-type ATP synthase membrane subunit b/b'
LDILGIPGAIVIQGGAVGVLFFVILAIVTGRLVPRKTLEDLIAERDAHIAREVARGDEWHRAAEAQDARNDVLSRQVDKLLDSAQTTNALIEGLKKASQERRR